MSDGTAVPSNLDCLIFDLQDEEDDPPTVRPSHAPNSDINLLPEPPSLPRLVPGLLMATIPNNILHNIAIHMDQPKEFLALSLISKRFQSTIATVETRSSFVKQWFDTHDKKDGTEYHRTLKSYLKEGKAVELQRRETAKRTKDYSFLSQPPSPPDPIVKTLSILWFLPHTQMGKLERLEKTFAEHESHLGLISKGVGYEFHGPGIPTRARRPRRASGPVAPAQPPPCGSSASKGPERVREKVELAPAPAVAAKVSSFGARQPSPVVSSTKASRGRDVEVMMFPPTPPHSEDEEVPVQVSSPSKDRKRSHQGSEDDYPVSKRSKAFAGRKVDIEVFQFA
ncbi:hypothetical protein BJ508DRAFT_327128 [Ascobolus immersus RN42]|uniref:F-box domain-containing protein n=1 Tax=Ascobolus immersus RN42 TaxID=1160509 RepID=A0A3N4I555_ASCIM|nr:hypothetical protein BJ508DRAFT_327128 [Ascobolus immersus RN42]